ncbi:MAG: tetratricopeptide repeat protein [Sedimentisphaerales bacterium]|nr:tetratricopeptide repeat protein [Sedimentisphaerales bacterium]
MQVLLKFAQAVVNMRPQKQKNIDSAIKVYRRVLRIEPDNTEAVEKLIQIYLNMDLASEAEFIAERYLKENSSSKIQKMLAAAFIKQRKFRQAAELLKIVIDDNPQDISACEQLGILAEQRKESYLIDQDYWFDQVVSNNPKTSLAYIVRGAHYLRMENKSKAFADFEHAGQFDLSNPQVQLRLAEEFLNAGLLDKAEYHLTEVQKQIPQSLKLWQLWAKLALKSKSEEQLLWVANTGTEELDSDPWDFMPDCTELFIEAGHLQAAEKNLILMAQQEIAPAQTAYLQGLIAEKQRKNYLAIKNWRQALQLGADSAKTRLKLANALIEVGDELTAINQLKILLSKYPDLAEAQLMLADLLLKAGNPADAYEHALIAQIARPKNLKASLLKIKARMLQFNRHKLNKNHIDWQKLEDELNQLPDDNIEVLKTLLQLSLSRSQFNKAQLILSKIKEKSPNSPEADLAQAQTLKALGRDEEAINILRQSVQSKTFTVDIVQGLVSLLIENNKHEECEQILTGSLEQLKGYDEKRKITLLLSSLYYLQGQPDNRHRLLQTYLESYPDDVVIVRELLSCLEMTHKKEEAMNLIDKIKAVEGDNSRRWRYEQVKFWLTYEDYQKNYSDITALLEKNLAENPNDQSSKLLLALFYEKTGRDRMASLTYSQAMDCLQNQFSLFFPAIVDLLEMKRQMVNETFKTKKQDIEEIKLPELRLKNRLGILTYPEIEKVYTLTRKLLDIV